MKLTESMTIIFPTALWAIMIAKLISPIILNLIVTLHLQDPIKIPLYNTFTTNNADERHTGSGIAIPYTTVSLYTTTESPHHHHSPHISTTTVVVSITYFSAHKSLPGSSIPGDHFPTPMETASDGQTDRTFSKLFSYF